MRDALQFYWNFRDKGKAMMANTDQLLKLVAKQTQDFQQLDEPAYSSLGWWRKQYPAVPFRENSGIVETQNRYTKQWIAANEVQWD